MSMEPALAAISGMIFLGETLTTVQTLALCSIIAASMGSTLTMRPEPKVQNRSQLGLKFCMANPPCRIYPRQYFK